MLAQQAGDPSALATALIAGGFTVLGVVLTLAGALLANRQNARRAVDATLRAERREAERHREREVRERAAELFGALQRLVDAETTLGLAGREAESGRLVDLRLAAQGHFDAFMFVAPSALLRSADAVWQAYQALGPDAAAGALPGYYRARYAFANAVRAQYGLDALPQ